MGQNQIACWGCNRTTYHSKEAFRREPPWCLGPEKFSVLGLALGTVGCLGTAWASTWRKSCERRMLSQCHVTVKNVPSYYQWVSQACGDQDNNHPCWVGASPKCYVPGHHCPPALQDSEHWDLMACYTHLPHGPLRFLPPVKSYFEHSVRKCSRNCII